MNILLLSFLISITLSFVDGATTSATIYQGAFLDDSTANIQGFTMFVDKTNGARYYLGITDGSLSTFTGLPPPKDPYVGGFGGSQDLVVLKLNADNSISWLTYIGGAGTDNPGGIIANANGVYVTGYTSGAIYGMTPAGTDIFLVKLSPSDGSRLWIKLIGNTTNEQTSAGMNQITFDSNGNLWFVGRRTGSGFNTDAYIVGYNVVDNTYTETTFGGSAADYGNTIAVQGDTVLVGGISASSDLPANNGSGSVGGFVVFFTKSSSNILTRVYSQAGFPSGTTGVTWVSFYGNDYLVNYGTNIARFNIATKFQVGAANCGTSCDVGTSVPVLIPRIQQVVFLGRTRPVSFDLTTNTLMSGFGSTISSSTSYYFNGDNPTFNNGDYYDSGSSVFVYAFGYHFAFSNPDPTKAQSIVGTQYSTSATFKNALDFFTIQVAYQITSASMTSAQFTSAPITTAQLTTAVITTSQITSSSVTSSELTSSAMTTSPITSEAITSAEMTTQEVTTDALTTSETPADITSSEMTTAATLDLTTSEMTTADLTTSEITTADLTTSEMTTSDLTTSEITTAALTTSETPADITSSEMTTAATLDLTTSEMTTADLTTASITTSKMTTASVTTSKITTSPLTTSEITSSDLTTSEMTTDALTTSEMTSDSLTEITTSDLTTSEITTAASNTSNITTSSFVTGPRITDDSNIQSEATSIAASYLGLAMCMIALML